MALLSMSDTFSMDSLDPVDAVLKTDETFERIMAASQVNDELSVDKVLDGFREAGEIVDTRDDEDDELVDESSFDLSNPVDICMLGEDTNCPDCSDPDLNDDDGEMIDEIINSLDGDDEPGSPDDEEDTDMIDAVADDNKTVDNTGYQTESYYDDDEYFYESAEDDLSSDDTDSDVDLEAAMDDGDDDLIEEIADDDGNQIEEDADLDYGDDDDMVEECSGRKISDTTDMSDGDDDAITEDDLF